MVDTVISVDSTVLPRVASRAGARIVAGVVHAHCSIGARVELFCAEWDLLLAEFACSVDRLIGDFNLCDFLLKCRLYVYEVVCHRLK